MKKLSIFLFFFLVVHVITAQEETKNNISISTRDFLITTIKVTSDNASQEGKVSAKLKATYDSYLAKVKVDFLNGDTMQLNYPLSFQYFSEVFSSKISAKNNGQVPHYSSLLEVFYWIVGVTEQLKSPPESGELLLQQGLITYTGDNPDLYEKRETTKMKLVEKRDIVKAAIENYKLKSTIEVIKIFCDPQGNILQTSDDHIRLIDIAADDIKISAIKSSMFVDMNKDTEDLFSASLLKKFGTTTKTEGLNDTIVAKGELLIQKYKTSYPLIQNGSKNEATTFYYVKQIDTNRQALWSLKLQEDALLAAENDLVTKGYYTIEKIKFHFERGFLERIQVYVKYGAYQKVQIFENYYPIGFSSILNYKKFKDIKLFIRNADRDDNSAHYIFLSDVVQNYDNELDIATKDYSPADTAFTAFPSKNPIVKLFKQKAIYIIEGKTFTDASGFNAKSPNGLVQVELNRRFNLKTNRTQITNSKNYGFLTYMIAQVNFSKIEDKLKGLPLRNEKVIENNIVVSPSYATNLDFLRYENLSIRTETNIFLYDVPENKVTFYGDIGFKYGHTPVIDTLYKVESTGSLSTTALELDAHNFTIYPKLWLEIFAERRYGFSASYQFNYTELFSNNFYKQVVSYSGKGNDLTTLSLNKSARMSHTIELKARFDSNPQNSNGKIFAVARFNFQHKDVNTFYPQILIGYAFNIFK